MIKIGIGSYTFPWAIGVSKYPLEKPMNALGLVNKAIAMNVDKVQFADNLPLHELTSEERNEIKILADSANIGLEVGTRGLLVEHIEMYAQIANEFNSPFLRVVIDDTDYRPNPNQVVKSIYALLPVLRRNDVVLAIENHDRFTSETLSDIIELTDSEYVGICLDTANSLGVGEGILEVLRTLKQYTVNLHIKDITIERLSHNMGFQVLGCPAGEGNIDIPFLIRTLGKQKKFYSATLEVWSDFTNSITETVAREELWAQRSISYLQKIKTEFNN